MSLELDWIEKNLAQNPLGGSRVAIDNDGYLLTVATDGSALRLSEVLYRFRRDLFDERALDRLAYDAADVALRAYRDDIPRRGGDNAIQHAVRHELVKELRKFFEEAR